MSGFFVNDPDPPAAKWASRPAAAVWGFAENAGEWFQNLRHRAHLNYTLKKASLSARLFILLEHIIQIVHLACVYAVHFGAAVVLLVGLRRLGVVVVGLCVIGLLI